MGKKIEVIHPETPSPLLQAFQDEPNATEFDVWWLEFETLKPAEAAAYTQIFLPPDN